MTEVPVSQRVQCAIRDSTETTIYNAIEDFGFGGYGLDDLEEIMGLDWHRDLARKITGALLDRRREDERAGEHHGEDQAEQDEGADQHVPLGMII